MKNNIKPLTRRQLEALEFIKSFIEENNYPPTIRELANYMRYQSSSTAFNIMEQLVKKGFIIKGTGPRMLQVIEKEDVCNMCREEPGEIWIRNTKSGKKIVICRECHGNVWGVDKNNGQGA